MASQIRPMVVALWSDVLQRDVRPGLEKAVFEKIYLLEYAVVRTMLGFERYNLPEKCFDVISDDIQKIFPFLWNPSYPHVNQKWRAVIEAGRGDYEAPKRWAELKKRFLEENPQYDPTLARNRPIATRWPICSFL